MCVVPFMMSKMSVGVEMSRKLGDVLGVWRVGVRLSFVLGSVFLFMAVGVGGSVYAGGVGGGAGGGTIRDIVVTGNQRISASTIKTYAGMEVGGDYSDEMFSDVVKNLYETGFFVDVTVRLDETKDGVVVIMVEESPIINRIVFEGNDDIKTENLENEIGLTPREVYTRSKVQKATERLLEIYRRSGRFSATVRPKIIERPDNRVDLVFEIDEDEVTNVSKIIFVGNKAFPDKTLEGEILTEESRWYRFFSSDDTYDPDRVAFDKELLRRFYLRNGYIDFSVVSALGELTPDGKSFIVTYTLREGERYRVGKVSTVGQFDEVKDVDFSDVLEQEEGDWYSSDDVDATINSLNERMGELGFAFVAVRPRIQRDQENSIVDVRYSLEEGEKVFIERINIIGNKRTLDEVIRRELLVSEGDLFNAELVRQSREELSRMGLFSNVDVRNRRGTSSDHTVLDIDVQETATGELSLGAGFSTTDGALGNLRIRERNFLGKNQDILFSFNISNRRQDFEVSFTDPYVFDRRISTGIDLYNLERDYESEAGYTSRSFGGALRTGYRILPRLSQDWRYSIEDTTIDRVDSRDVRGFSISGTGTSPVYERMGEMFRDTIGVIENDDGLTSSITHSLTYDDRNSFFNPTEGLYARARITYAGLGGRFAYWKYEGRIAFYHPFAPGWVARLQINAGHIQGTRGKTVRPEDRFFLGGDDFRGFEFYGIGPRVRSSLSSRGGNTYYVAQLEQSFPLGLPQELGIEGRAFADFGSLFDVDGECLVETTNTGTNAMTESRRRCTDSDLEQVYFLDKSPRFSIGVGVAWSSPFGPVRIYYGFPVKKKHYDRREQLRFTFGTRF